MNNAGFMAKAPEKLVLEEREKLEKYKEIDEELQMVPITFDYVFK